MQKRLRAALRNARLDRHLTQSDVAKKLEWSTSKLIRIEQGASRISITDLRALMAVYGATDTPDADNWVNWARGARQPQVWSEYKVVYSEAAIELFGTEQAARDAYQFEPTFIPGLLQTEDYARALLEGLGNSGDNLERKVKARLERQEMFDHEERPTFTFIIGEASVSRTVGSHRTMRNQITHLIAMSKLPNTTIRILPFSAGPHPRMTTSFTSLQFDDPDLDAVYFESPHGNKIVREDPDEIAAYNSDFSDLEPKSISDIEPLLASIVESRFG
jgi:transcriptional regulator with XRE-family HTH domain